MHVPLFFCYVACCIQSVSPWTFQNTFQQSYFDGGQACMQAFPGIMTHWRKVTSYLMFLFFNCLCFSILYLIFSEAFSAAWWWKARRISSISNHLKEVGPTFFFPINIFVFTQCFACLFRSLFCALGWKSKQAVFSTRNHLRKAWKVRICTALLLF